MKINCRMYSSSICGLPIPLSELPGFFFGVMNACTVLLAV